MLSHKSCFVSACVCVLSLALIGSAQIRADTGTDPEPPTTTSTTATPAAAPLVGPQRDFQKVLDRYRHQVWQWQQVMGRPFTTHLTNPPTGRDAKVVAWRRLVVRVRRQASHPPHLRQWLCIHRFEGAWNDPNPPYFGGLQMDLSFQQRYALHLLRKKGTANHWTPLEQMWAAERAHRSGRGFFPWPNTARYCGLL